eukprot:jgi/Botrbrau1/12237/Bobra.0361s0004.3
MGKKNRSKKSTTTNQTPQLSNGGQTGPFKATQEKKKFQTTNVLEPASSFASTLTDSQKSQPPAMPSNAVSASERREDSGALNDKALQFPLGGMPPHEMGYGGDGAQNVHAAITSLDALSLEQRSATNLSEIQEDSSGHCLGENVMPGTAHPQDGGMYPGIPSEDRPRVVHPGLVDGESLADAKHFSNSPGSLPAEESSRQLHRHSGGGAAQLLRHREPWSADGEEPVIQSNTRSVEQVGSAAEEGKELVPLVAAKIGGRSSAMDDFPTQGCEVPDQPLNVQPFVYSTDMLMLLSERTTEELRTAQESSSKNIKFLDYEYCWEEMYPSLPHIYDRRKRRLRNSSRVFIDVLHPLVCRILLGMLLGFPKEKDPVPLSKYDWQHLCDAFDFLDVLEGAKQSLPREDSDTEQSLPSEGDAPLASLPIEDATLQKDIFDALAKTMVRIVQWLSSDAWNIRIRAEADDLNVAIIWYILRYLVTITENRENTVYFVMHSSKLFPKDLVAMAKTPTEPQILVDERRRAWECVDAAVQRAYPDETSLGVLFNDLKAKQTDRKIIEKVVALRMKQKADEERRQKADEERRQKADEERQQKADEERQQP